MSFFLFLDSVSLHLFVSQKSLNDEERGGNCLLLPERSYGPGISVCRWRHKIPKIAVEILQGVNNRTLNLREILRMVTGYYWRSN